MDPRIRQRRVEVQRAVGRRRLHIAFAALGGLSLIVVSLVALHSPLASVRRVTLSGAGHEGVGTVLAAAGITRGEPLTDVDPAGAARSIEALPWVGTATVARAWPSGLTVRITERTAVAQVPVGASSSGPVMLVDATGRLLQRLSSPQPDLPIVLGAGATGTIGSWLAGSAGARADSSSRLALSDDLDRPRSTVDAALALASSFASDGIDRSGQGVGPDHAWIDQVNVASDGTLSALVEPSSVTMSLGADTDLAAKLTAVTTVLHDVALTNVSNIDLTVPNRPALTESATWSAGG
jgi:hypothetical protein